MLVKFTTERPNVRMKLHVGNRSEIVAMLSRKEIDLAIMGTPPREFRINAARFAHHPMAFVASPKHALMRKKRVTLDVVVAANLLVRERGSGTRTTVERVFKEAGHTLHFGSEVSSNEAIKSMVAAGLGVGFVSVHACALEFEAGLIDILPMKESPVEGDWHVMHLVDQPLPRIAAAFQDFMVTSGQELIGAELESFYRKHRKPGR
jgi:DNA-binding transcriptional LysR family regulator